MDIIPIRRLTTADDERGRSYATVDFPTDRTFQQGVRPVALTDLWRMKSVPTSLTADEHRSQTFQLNPPASGVAFRVVQFDPGANRAPVDAAAVFASMGADTNHAGDNTHPYMHRTLTVDFGIVLRGAITMVLDDEEHHLSSGDIVIQRGTNHEWRNDSNEPCQVAFVLVAADETGTSD